MKNVIIADDHPFMLKGIATYVEQLGYQLLKSRDNGITALNLIQAYQPTIAVLDINMPNLNGLEAVQKMNESKLPTRAILLTLHKDIGVYKKALADGVYGYLLKDYVEDESANCLQAVSEGKRYTSASLLNDLEYHYKGKSDGLGQLTIC